MFLGAISGGRCTTVIMQVIFLPNMKYTCQYIKAVWAKMLKYILSIDDIDQTDN
jgi:hypothetical protein